MNWLSKFFALGSKTKRAARSTHPRRRLNVELLEDRQLMASGLAVSAVASVTPPDMTTVAKMFPAHSGPTTLYLNFDGWTNYDKPLFQAEADVCGYSANAAGIAYDVSNFASDVWNSLTGHDSMPQHNITAFQGTTGNREADIHDIMYRVSEIFAPFNVQVRRITGDGTFNRTNGNTTIFVGKDSSPGGAANYTPTPFVDISGKSDYGPLGVLDAVRTAYRAPNSDPFDLAFVDRHANQDNLTTAQAIAHEAGHTFGLAHVRVDGLTDASGSIPFDTAGAPDVMSYDSGNEAFFNQSFTITDYNNTGGAHYVIDTSLHPKWGQVSIAKQNSYTYLQAVLGNRPTDDGANVADPAAVGVTPTAPQVVLPNSVVTHNIERLGDYDVFQLANVSSVTGTLYLSVQRLSGTLDPVLMVYAGFSASDDYHGVFENYVALRFNNDRASNDTSSVIALPAGAIHYASSVKVVVGAANGATTGGYRLTITTHAPDLAVNPIDFQILSRTTPGSGRVRITGTITNQGNMAFVSASAPATAMLIESINGVDKIVANRTLGSVAPGQLINLTYDRNWSPPAPPHGGLGTGTAPVGNLGTTGGSQSSVGSMASSSTPTGTPTTIEITIPVYRLVIKVPGFNSAGNLLDGDPTNNETLRSGSDITAMFGPAQAMAASAPAKPVVVPLANTTKSGSTELGKVDTEIKASEGTTAGAIRG